MSDRLVHPERAGLFHDFELGNITVDYRNKRVVLQLKSPSLPMPVHELTLFGVQCFQVGIEEPWGKGIYVVGTDIEQEGSTRSMEMQLNSGDLVTAIFARAEFDSAK
ncbi:MAG: hypothetical protein K2P04_04480 [Oscillospiraceae bacterium]|nr:hypothetical protein [Oscillospiraceae bacterium]